MNLNYKALAAIVIVLAVVGSAFVGSFVMGQTTDSTTANPSTCSPIQTCPTTTSTSTVTSTSTSTTTFPLGFVPRSEYVVKFYCVENGPGTSFMDLGLEDGNYSTNVNIHNPSFQRSNVTLVLKFAGATLYSPLSNGGSPQYIRGPSLFGYYRLTLAPDAIATFGCTGILSAIGVLGGFGVVTDGFVIIYSNLPPTAGQLDVWAAYTSQHAPYSVPPSVNVVSVPPEKFKP